MVSGSRVRGRGLARLAGAVGVVTVVGVVTAGPAVAGAGDARVPAEPATEAVLTARADESRRLSAPFPRPDGAPRVQLAGDSVATTLEAAIGDEAARRGAGFASTVRPGCGLLPGLPTTRDGYTPPWASACDAASAAFRGQVAGTPADLVLVLSTWDGSTRLLDGVFVDPGTPAGFQTAVDLVRGMVDDVAPAGSGRHVVLLAEAVPTTGSDTGAAKPERVLEARQHRAVYREVARADPARVRVIDLNQWLCPAGPPCPETVEGIVARPRDGGHFSPEGAAWLAPRLLDALSV
jgi:hypothetical protein